jgi:outer membrane receptor protein involved in Fe transport
LVGGYYGCRHNIFQKVTLIMLHTKTAFRVKLITMLTTLAISSTNALAEEGGTKDNVVYDAIVVMGEKSEKSLKDSTSSVSVITDETLDTMQHQTISDAISGLANVVVLTGSVPDIRGVTGNGGAGGFNSISGGANARVSTLIDGVAEPFVADLTGDSGIWDIEQVEVYRGPQSTINGRNSIGGSIFIKTKDPTFDWEAAARIGYRNKDNYVDKSVMASGPIIDDVLAFRVTGQFLDAQTLTNNEDYDTNPADYDLNEIKTKRLKGKLLWTPTDSLSALLSYSTNNEDGDTGRIYYSGGDPYDFERIYLRDITTESDTASLNVNYKINDSMSVDVLSAVMDYKWGFNSYDALPTSRQVLSFDETNYTFDAKLNFGLDSKTFNGFVGIAYFEREQDILSKNAIEYNGDDESHSAALYSELTFGLSDRFNIITGGRLQRETQERNFVYGAIDSDLDTTETIFLPKLVFQYDLTDTTTVSAGARQGYNSAGGALNFTTQEYYYYDKEEVDTYEITLRSSFADGNVNLSANAFYNEYSGYQALSSSRSIVNMDDVETYGLELEVNAHVTQDLELNAGLGLLKTEIKDAGVDFTSATGNELNSAPDMTASLGAKYWLTNEFDVGATLNYVSEYYGDISNTEDLMAGNYTLVRLNANYEIDNWRVAAFVNNVFDKEANVVTGAVSGAYPTGYAAIVAPRNMGVSLTYTY